ncbi:delta(12) fatty acid desaturase-like protein [Tanacetum coccineum]
MAASDDMKLFERVPISNPPFGYDDLKRAIPPHCFAKSLKRSLYLLSNEIFLTCTFYYVASNYIDFLPKVLSYIAWPLYWIVQGLALGRLWSIGHDCSHHSFCGYGWLDDTIEGLASHYYLQSVLFINSQRAKVFLSDVGVLVFIYAYYRIVMTQGAIWLFNLFGGPWVSMCGILLVLSYLQHNHPSIPHFDSLEWSWIRGALSTVDRDVGLMIVKNKTDNHVVHHLFPAIPSYHAHEATEAIKPMLGDYYKYDGTSFLKAFWREMKECIFVEPDDYDDEDKKKNGVYWSSSFNTESEDASFNLNFDAGDEDENEMHEVSRLMGRDKARGSKERGRIIGIVDEYE